MLPSDNPNVKYAPVPTQEPERGRDAAQVQYQFSNATDGLGHEMLPNPDSIPVGMQASFLADLDYDGSGQVDEFEIYFADILTRASEGKMVSLTSDVWGCATFTVITDLPKILAGQVSTECLLRFSYVFLIALLNIVIQCGLLYWITIYVMRPAIRETQEVYLDFHKIAFSIDGRFSLEKFGEFSDSQELCQFPLYDTYFCLTVLFLWCTQCFTEIRSTQRMCSGLVSLPTLPWGIPHNHMIRDTLHDSDPRVVIERAQGHLDKCSDNPDVSELVHVSRTLLELAKDSSVDPFKYCVCLTPITRFLTYVLVLLPRLFIILVLMSVGCMWLLATDKFDSLILNALALQFIVEVDNLLGTMFFPVSLHSQVEQFKIATPGSPQIRKSISVHQFKSGMEDLPGYFRSILYFCMVMATVFVHAKLQPVLPGFSGDLEEACRPYIERWSAPKFGFAQLHLIYDCVMGTEQCFPFGSAEDSDSHDSNSSS